MKDVSGACVTDSHYNIYHIRHSFKFMYVAYLHVHTF